MMLAKFRDRYPQGSLVSKLVQIDRGNFIVKVSIKLENITLVTALASASNVEAAEDAARTRAIAALCLDRQTTSPVSAPKFSQHIPLVEPPQVQVEKRVATERKDFLVNNQVVSSVESETANLSQSNSVSRNPSSPLTASESEVVAAKSAQVSSNLFEGTLTSPSNPAPLENHQNIPSEINEETNPVDFEFADQPIGDLAKDDPPVKVPKIAANFDFTQVKQKTDIEIARLGWTRDDGREFLQSRYGKRSRLHLKDEELQEFLSYLEQLPTPVT